MPRKRRKQRVTGGSIWQRLKSALSDLRLYSTVVYLFLMFPLGIFYFSLLVTLLTLTVVLVAGPITALALGTGTFSAYLPDTPVWFDVFSIVMGFILLTWTLHLVNLMAKAHGVLSRALLLKR